MAISREVIDIARGALAGWQLCLNLLDGAQLHVSLDRYIAVWRCSVGKELVSSSATSHHASRVAEIVFTPLASFSTLLTARLYVR